MKRLTALAALAALSLSGSDASAWEAATTHAGLTETSALASKLHKILRERFGYEAGLLAPLTIPPADAPDLFAILRDLNPTHGYVPDARGQLGALGWLVAGSVVADTPASLAANHYLNPWTGGGLDDRTLDDGAGALLRSRLVPGADHPHGGIAANRWLRSPANPMGYAGFASQLRLAVSSRSKEERDRHLAGALLAAGAMLHALQDMGSPAHVRVDLAAQLEVVGPDGNDRASRFERLAALAYERLGVPDPGPAPTSRAPDAYFIAPEGDGLAQRTATNYFSRFTLPESVELRAVTSGPEVRKVMRRSVRLPAPLPTSLDLIAAQSEAGGTMVNAAGTCLARYRLREGRLRWSIDDECALEQVAALLPEVGAAGVGFLEALFRGSLELRPAGGSVGVTSTGALAGAGTLIFYWEDSQGVRTEYARAPVADGGALPLGSSPPTGAVRIAALFDGVDSSGTPLLAVGSSAFPFPEPSPDAVPPESPPLAPSEEPPPAVPPTPADSASAAKRPPSPAREPAQPSLPPAAPPPAASPPASGTPAGEPAQPSAPPETPPPADSPPASGTAPPGGPPSPR